MKFKMDNKGINSYISALKQRLNYIKSTISNEIKDDLQLYSPKRTGNLASSYKIVSSDEKDQIFNDCGYCKFVNDGTIYQSGQHFIELSISEVKENINKIVEDSQKIDH